MSAKHAVNPNQLSMFMSADEITTHYQPLDLDRQMISDTGSPHLETDTEVWSRKLQESKPPSRVLHQSIQEQGVRDPVRLSEQMGKFGKPQVTGGHHRIAAQQDIDPHALMPVLHEESWNATKWHADQYWTSGKGFKYT